MPLPSKGDGLPAMGFDEFPIIRNGETNIAKMVLMDGNNFREDDVHPVDFRQTSSWIREANRFVADGSSTGGIYGKDELIATRLKYSTTNGWVIQPPASTLDW